MSFFLIKNNNSHSSSVKRTELTYFKFWGFGLWDFGGGFFFVSGFVLVFNDSHSSLFNKVFAAPNQEIHQQN